MLIAKMVPWVVAGLILSAMEVSAQPFPVVPTPVERIQFERLGRTLALLKQGRETERSVLRMLFYGQSITQQDWTRWLASGLRSLYPGAQVFAANRSISGFSTELLVQTVDRDVASYAPDLLVFQAFGDDWSYERLLRKVRQSVTADILVLTDHLQFAYQLSEETNQVRLMPETWAAWHNRAYLPAAATRRDAALADVRDRWADHLRSHNLLPDQLLGDNVHLNDAGNRLLYAVLERYFLPPHDLVLPDPDNCPGVATFRPGRDWMNGSNRIDIDVTGNRIEVLTAVADERYIGVRVNGKRPSEFSGGYFSTPPSRYSGTDWEPFVVVGSRVPILQTEIWTLTVVEGMPDASWFRFRVDGSVSGFDGEGTNVVDFVSNSGRVVLEANQWRLVDAARETHKPLLVGSAFTWSIELLGTDTFQPQAAYYAHPAYICVAHGLEDTAHHVTLEGAPEVLSLIDGIRVYSPSGRARRSPEIVTGPRLVIEPHPSTLRLLWNARQPGYLAEQRSTQGADGAWQRIPGRPGPYGDSYGWNILKPTEPMIYRLREEPFTEF